MLADSPFQECLQKVPVNIPVTPSIMYLSHVLPELGNDAKAMSGKCFRLLNFVSNFLQCSSLGHGHLVLDISEKS